MARSVLEGVRGVVPGLAAGDLEAAADLGVAVDADDLLALRALPALEPVGRALQLHARAALVTDLALQGRGGGAAVVGAHSRRLLAPPGRRRDAPPGWPNSTDLASLQRQLPHTDLASGGSARALPRQALVVFSLVTPVGGSAIPPRPGQVAGGCRSRTTTKA